MTNAHTFMDAHRNTIIHFIRKRKMYTVHSILHRILSEDVATSLFPKSSRLAHLYGLPKTQSKIEYETISSASGTYNFNLA